MATEIIMPKAGMDMQEGQIIKWKKKKGDYVEKGETLLEIMTDKVNMEVEAEVSGYLLEILYEEGAKVPVITTIGYIGEKDEEIIIEDKPERIEKTGEKSKIENEKIEIGRTRKEKSKGMPGKVRATPAARKIARDYNIDLYQVQGTGPNGRIQKIDVEKYIKTSSKATPLAKRIAEIEGVELENISGTGIQGKIVKNDVLDVLYDMAEEDRVKVIPMSNMRKIIAERMVESFFSAPTFTLNIEVDMRKTLDLIEETREIIMKETGKKLTLTDIILFATTKSLLKHPYINASLSGENIVLHNYVNLAFAIGMEQGLLTPVIVNAHEKTLTEMVVAAKDLQERALNMRLSPDELKGSTFTVSNLGMYDITHFNPIINQPNSAILGVNTIVEKLAKEDGKIITKPMMTLSLTVDHRVIDGVIGAKFLQELKYFLENPMSMLI